MARCPKPPVSPPDLEAASFEDRELQTWFLKVLQDQESRLLQILQEREHDAKQHTEQQHAATFSLVEHALASLESRLIHAGGTGKREPLKNPAANSTNGVTREAGSSTTRTRLDKAEVTSAPTHSGDAHQQGFKNLHDNIRVIDRSCLKGQAVKKKKCYKSLNTLHQLQNMAVESEELKRHACSCLHRFVRAGPLDNIIGVVIGVSTLITILDWEVEGCRSNATLFGYSCGQWEDPYFVGILSTATHVFNLCFMIELVLRVVVLGRTFFFSAFNLFDSCVIIVAMVDAYVLVAFEVSRGQNLAFARILRYARFSRTVRLVRQFRIFGPLRILMNTIVVSFHSLIWSLVILAVAQLLTALLLCQSLTNFIRDEQNDYETRVWVNRMYGSSSKAFYTLFEVTLSGCWPNYVRPLIEEVSAVYAIFYLAYIVCVVFAIIRIITALFLRDTLAQAANDAETQSEMAKKNQLKFEDKLLELFEFSDKSKDGRISYEEFTQVFNNPDVKSFCSLIDIQLSEVHALFDLIDDGDGMITYSEFVNSMSRLKGHATSQDVVTILHDCHHILTYCQTMEGLLRQAVDTPHESEEYASYRLETNGQA